MLNAACIAAIATAVAVVTVNEIMHPCMQAMYAPCTRQCTSLHSGPCRKLDQRLQTMWQTSCALLLLTGSSSSNSLWCCMTSMGKVWWDHLQTQGMSNKHLPTQEIMP